MPELEIIARRDLISSLVNLESSCELGFLLLDFFRLWELDLGAPRTEAATWSCSCLSNAFALPCLILTIFSEFAGVYAKRLPAGVF